MSTLPPPLYSRKKPFPARLLVNQKLNFELGERDSHYEFSLAGSGLQYEVGDSMGFPQNNPQLVQELLDALHFSGDEQVKNKDGETVSIREGLFDSFPDYPAVEAVSGTIVEKSGGASELEGLWIQIEKPSWTTIFGASRSSISARRAVHPVLSRRVCPVNFASCSRASYSVGSSIKAYPEQVHLMIASVRYESRGRNQEGVASTYLADRVSQNATIDVRSRREGFPSSGRSDNTDYYGWTRYRVPPSGPICKSEKRSARRGKNWLIFGEQRSRYDFFIAMNLRLADGRCPDPVSYSVFARSSL
jgi:sulfite reductase (NADPH) flavoprotein alpha-component